MSQPRNYYKHEPASEPPSLNKCGRGEGGDVAPGFDTTISENPGLGFRVYGSRLGFEV